MSDSYVVAIRHPTGGIRTHIKYATELAPREPHVPRPVLVCPPGRDAREMLEALQIGAEAYAGQKVRSMGSFCVAIARAVRRHECKVIHSHGFSSAVAAFFPSILFRSRHVVTVHDVITPDVIRTSSKLALAALGLVLRNADVVHAVGDDCADSLRLLPFMRRAQNIVTIKNGINVRQFSDVVPADIRAQSGFLGDSFVIGFFGRFMAQKGFRILVDAMEILVRGRGIENVRVLAVGGGGFIREDRAYIEAHGLTDYFTFLDAVDDPAPLIAAVDVVVMPSKWEAYSLLAAEVLSVGTPLIASTCIGLREVTRDTPARTYSPNEPGALAAAITAERDESSKDGANSFRRTALERFDFSSSAKRLQEIIVRQNAGTK